MIAARRDRIAAVATLALLALSAMAFARGGSRSEVVDKLPWHADGAAAGLSLAGWLASSVPAAFGTARHVHRVALAAAVFTLGMAPARWRCDA